MLEKSVLSPALHCCPLAPCHVCTLTCGHRIPVLLETHANKAMQQTLWGGRSASASLPGAGEGGRALLFSYLVMRTRWCLAQGSVAAMAALMGWVGVHGLWVEWSWLSPLLASLFSKAVSLAFVPTFSILVVMYFLSRNMVRLDWCQSRRKAGLIGSALSVSDFLDGFVCVVCCCVGFSVCLFFLNTSAHFGA